MGTTRTLPALPCCSVLLVVLMLGTSTAHAAGVADLLLWLGQPLSGASEHELADRMAWHARLMVIGWGMLLPLGALIARFYKVMPSQDWPHVLDNKAWWHGHRLLQYTGIGAMTFGLLLVLNQGAAATPAARAHAWLGWVVCVAGWLQVVGGLARGTKGGPTEPRLRGDHYDMTTWRIVFERLHKTIGWMAIVLAVPTAVLGLVFVDAPRWMLLVLCAWWALLTCLFVRWQSQGRCIDTYQAIWGADASTHPGLHVPPVGWGVSRYTALSWRSRFPPRGEHGRAP